jgi:hypothetical protein
MLLKPALRSPKTVFYCDNLSEGDIWMSEGGGHRAMIPPLQNKNVHV